MAEAARNLDEDVSYEQGSLKKPQEPDVFKKPGLEGINQSKLTPAEVKALEDGSTTIAKLVQERNQYKQAAKAELEGIVKLEKSPKVVNFREYKSLKKDCEAFEREIEETESPEKMKEILERIKDLPKKKEREKLSKEEQKKEEETPLDINSKELKEFKDNFNKICDDNTDLIGTKEVPGFKKWFELELQKKPTIANAKDITDRLEGKIYDKGGLAPRRETYRELTGMFKRYKLESPQKSDYIRTEGHSERKAFLKEATSAENEIKRVNDSLWSPKAKDKVMQQVLLASSPDKQREITEKIKNVSKIESEGSIYMRNTMQVGGTAVRKMSDASISEFLKGLVDEGDINKRLDYITGFGKYANGIKEAVENEGSLAGKEVKPEVAKLFDVKKGLEGIYENDKEGLKTALKSFESLNFMQKIKALKEHVTLVEKTKNKEELQKILTVKAAHAKIDEAGRKKIISTTTQDKYKEWFKDEKNYKDPETQKPGSLTVLKKYYEILTSSTPDAKARNLSAYEIKRNRFKDEVKSLKDLNPNISEEELRKWQEKYDKRGWTERKRVFKDLKKEQEKLKKKKEKEKKKESVSEITSQDKNKEKVKNLTKSEAIKSAITLINDDQAAEALKKLIAYNDKDPDDKDIIFWMEVAMKRIKEFGSGKKLDAKTDKQIDDEIKSVAEADTGIKEEIQEENLITLNLEGTKLSEERHGKVKEGQDRAEKESVAQTPSGTLEADLTKDFYEQTDNQHILNEEGTGEKMTEIKFDDIKLTKEKIEALKQTTRDKETRLYDKKGFTHVKLKDKSGRQLSTEEAIVEQKKDLEELEDTLAKKAMKKVEQKTGKGEAGSNVFDLNARIAAKRKAHELIEAERRSHEGLRQ